MPVVVRAEAEDEAGVAGVAQDVVLEDVAVRVVEQDAAVGVEVRIGRDADDLVALDEVAAARAGAKIASPRLPWIVLPQDLAVLGAGDERDAELVVVDPVVAGSCCRCARRRRRTARRPTRRCARSSGPRRRRASCPASSRTPQPKLLTVPLRTMTLEWPLTRMPAGKPSSWPGDVAEDVVGAVDGVAVEVDDDVRGADRTRPSPSVAVEVVADERVLRQHLAAVRPSSAAMPAGQLRRRRRRSRRPARTRARARA